MRCSLDKRRIYRSTRITSYNVCYTKLLRPLSDRYGRRPVLLAGLALALAGIMLALAGHASLTALLLGRLV